MGSQKARVVAGTHIKPGQQGGHCGGHSIPLGRQRFDATALGVEARMVTMSIPLARIRGPSAPLHSGPRRGGSIATYLARGGWR